MKRICCLLLCLLLCCPLASFAEEDGIRVEIRPHQADFAFDLPDYEFVYVNYDTRTDSGKMVLYAPDGHFAGSCALPATDGAVNLGINVYALNGKQIMRSTVTTAADMTSKGPVAGLEQVKVTNTARDVMILPIKGGLYYSFTAPGRDSVVLKYRSPQESHSLTLYAGEDYKYQGSVDMPYTYDDDKVTVAVLSSTGSELYSEILTAYVDTLRAIPQAEEGRLKGVTVCIDPGHQRTTKVETVPAAPNSIEMKTTVVGMAQGVETKRRESIVVLEIGLLLRNALLAEGATVVMTRTEQDTFVGMLERADIPNEAGADFVLRLHCNSRTSGSIQGIEVYCPLSSSYAAAVADEAAYRKLGETLLFCLKAATRTDKGECTLNNTYVGNNWSKMPSFLVEMGYMTNWEEDLKLSSSAYQQKLVHGMVEGIVTMAKMRGPK